MVVNISCHFISRQLLFALRGQKSAQKDLMRITRAMLNSNYDYVLTILQSWNHSMMLTNVVKIMHLITIAIHISIAKGSRNVFQSISSDESLIGINIVSWSLHVGGRKSTNFNLVGNIENEAHANSIEPPTRS